MRQQCFAQMMHKNGRCSSRVCYSLLRCLRSNGGLLAWRVKVEPQQQLHQINATLEKTSWRRNLRSWEEEQWKEMQKVLEKAVLHTENEDRYGSGALVQLESILLARPKIS